MLHLDLKPPVKEAYLNATLSIASQAYSSREWCRFGTKTVYQKPAQATGLPRVKPLPNAPTAAPKTRRFCLGCGLPLPPAVSTQYRVALSEKPLQVCGRHRAAEVVALPRVAGACPNFCVSGSDFN